MIFGLYHAAHENAGLILDVLKSLKLPFTPIHLYEGDGLPRDISDLQGLIVMGGPMSVDEIEKYPFLLDEVQLIEKVIQEKKLVLGICLGAQLIAKALNSKVFPNHKREVGWHPIQLTAAGKADAIFKSFPDTMNVLHWHGDTFDLPKGAVLLASSKDCVNQAFRWGSSTYALQFHFEVTPSMVAAWCASSADKEYVKGAGQDPDNLIKETAAAYEKLAPLATKFFTDFLTAFKKPLPVA